MAREKKHSTSPEKTKERTFLVESGEFRIVVGKVVLYDENGNAIPVKKPIPLKKTMIGRVFSAQAKKDLRLAKLRREALDAIEQTAPHAPLFMKIVRRYISRIERRAWKRS